MSNIQRTLLRRSRMRIGVLTIALIGMTQAWASAQSAPSRDMRTAGRLLAIDPQQRIIRVEPDQQSGRLSDLPAVDFAITPDTVVTKAGQQVEPRHLRFGERVKIEYTVEHGQNVARSISAEQLTTPEESGQIPTPTTP